MKKNGKIQMIQEQMFRAKLAESPERWIFGKLYCDNGLFAKAYVGNSGTHHVSATGIALSAYANEVIKSTICQATGFKDIYCDDIFEQDTIMLTNSEGTHVFKTVPIINSEEWYEEDWYHLLKNEDKFEISIACNSFDERDKEILLLEQQIKRDSAKLKQLKLSRVL